MFLEEMSNQNDDKWYENQEQWEILEGAGNDSFPNEKIKEKTI